MGQGRLRDKLAAEALQPAYIVAGDDPLAIDEAVEAIVRKALNGAEAAEAVSWFDGEEAEPVAVLDALRTRPLFGPRRVVVVAGAPEFLKRAEKPIRAYLERPTSSSVLVLVARGIQNPANTFKAYASLAALVPLAAPRRTGEWVQWLVSRAALRGKRLAPADARLILDLVGGNVLALDSQIEKLAAYVGPRTSIQRADVEALVAPTRVEPVYELGDAVTARDLPRALRLAEELLAEGTEVPFIVGMLRSHLRRFWQAKRHRQAGRSPADAARALGEAHRTWLIEKLYESTDLFTQPELGRCFAELLKADVAMKTGAAPGELALEQFIVAACART